MRSTGADLSDEQAIQKALRAASWELRYTVEDWKDSEIEVGVFRLIRGLSHPDILRYNSLDNWRRIHPIDCLWKKLDTYTAQSEDEAHKWANENYPDAIFDPMSGA